MTAKEIHGVSFEQPTHGAELDKGNDVVTRFTLIGMGTSGPFYARVYEGDEAFPSDAPADAPQVYPDTDASLSNTGVAGQARVVVWAEDGNGYEYNHVAFKNI